MSVLGAGGCALVDDEHAAAVEAELRLLCEPSRQPRQLRNGSLGPPVDVLGRQPRLCMPVNMSSFQQSIKCAEPLMVTEYL